MKSPKCFGMGLLVGGLAAYFILKQMGNGGSAANGNGMPQGEPGQSYGNGALPYSNPSDQKTRIADRRYFEVARRAGVGGYQNFNIVA